MNRRLRIALTLVVSGLAFTYLVVKIDVHETARIIRDASPLWVATSICVILMMVFPMAWRWGLLLRAREISERFAWLLRAYFVSLAVGQLLPTSVGGDASRIYEATRRHRGQGATIAASVLVERALGGTVTLLLAAVGFLLAIGRYPIGAYLWISSSWWWARSSSGSSSSRRRRGRGLASPCRWPGSCASNRWRVPSSRVFTATGSPGTLGVVALATVVVQIGGILRSTQPDGR